MSKTGRPLGPRALRDDATLDLLDTRAELRAFITEVTHALRRIHVADRHMAHGLASLRDAQDLDDARVAA